MINNHKSTQSNYGKSKNIFKYRNHKLHEAKSGFEYLSNIR